MPQYNLFTGLPEEQKKPIQKQKPIVKSLTACSNRRSKEPLIYNQVSVHIDRINITRHFEVQRKSKHQIIDNTAELNISTPVVKKQIKYTVDDKMSQPTIRKIQKAVRYLNFMAVDKKMTNVVSGKDFKFKICFATLTLSSPQVHSDNVLKKILINQLLVELKKKYKIINYVWRLEKQLNGNAHFHFLFDKFIPHTELREVWNRLQNKLGYVDRYRDKMINISFNDYKKLYGSTSKKSESQIRAAYAKGKATKWAYPNSTDIHSLLFINDIDKYLIKYMSKDEQNKGIEGRLWGCSQSLSNITGAREIVDSSISAELDNLINCGSVRHVKGDYYEILFLDWFILETCKCYILMDLLRQYLILKFNIKSKDYAESN